MVSEPILHVDMDAFYASVEVLKDPSLRGKPVIVGGQGSRGVVTSASYEARAFGVGSAMPVVRARRLCPHGIFVPNDFSSYQDLSRQIRRVFESFTPLVEPLSLDEAFLDVSGSVRLFGSPLEIARQIKAAISRLGLVCTVGVAPNKFLAKLASASAKPDGLLVVPADDVRSFLHPLPVSALWGVGPQTDETLRRLGMKRVGDLASLSRRTLERALGEAQGAHLHALANGLDSRPVVVDEPSKSVGSEETYERDLDSSEEVLRELLRLADRTAGRLRTKSLCGRTITIKIRFSNFKTITRSKTLPFEVDTAAEIYEVAKELCARLHLERARIRLAGIAVSGLGPGPPRRQLELLAGQGAQDEAPDQRRRSAARAVDAIRSRFGEASVAPAALLQNPD
jgi:DNA polymerase IV